jgi:hypothetical protein
VLAAIARFALSFSPAGRVASVLVVVAALAWSSAFLSLALRRTGNAPKTRERRPGRAAMVPAGALPDRQMPDRQMPDRQMPERPLRERPPSDRPPPRALQARRG